MNIKVKICGIRTLEDALCCTRSGAWALGFNFYPQSPRYIQPEEAARIIERLPAEVLKVGLFVNEKTETVQRIREQCKLDFVQFSGDETAVLRQAAGGRIIQAVRPESAGDLPSDDELAFTEMILIDAPKSASGLYGGSGRKASAEAASELVKRGFKILFAGGITPENAVERYQSCHPYALDLASGVERTPGVKDPSKIQSLFHQLETSL